MKTTEIKENESNEWNGIEWMKGNYGWITIKKCCLLRDFLPCDNVHCTMYSVLGYHVLDFPQIIINDAKSDK